MDNLVEHSAIDKVFLFDVNLKIYVATDSLPVDIPTYEVCAEFIDITIDLEDLYEGRTRSDLKLVSHLANGLTLYLKQMIRGLALVALVRIEPGVEPEATLAVVDYNVEKFKQLLKLMWESLRIR